MTLTSINKFGIASIRKAVLSGRRLYGANVTGAGCAPPDPYAVATDLSRIGFNWVRLHKMERGLARGEFTIQQVLAFVDALYSKGIRVSTDGFAELELDDPYPGGTDQFIRDLYAGVPEAIVKYGLYVDRLEPILSHRACFMVCLVNEGAYLTTPAQAAEFFKGVSPKFRRINPDLLLTDCPDGCSQALWPVFAQVAQGYDVAVGHYYNSDGQGTGTGDNIFDGWNWNGVWKYAEITGKRMLVQEFGSYKSNPNQGSNIAFVMAECARRGFGMCHFAYATNLAGYEPGGDPANVFGMTNDPMRIKMAYMGALLSKYALGAPADWPGERDEWGTSYRLDNGVCRVDREGCSVSYGSSRFLWRWDRDQPEWWMAKMEA